MENFQNRTFLSSDGDKIIASCNENKLRISNPSIIMDVELNGIQMDNWYERGNIRIKLDDDVLHISKDLKGFPTNTVKYFRVN